MLQSVLGLVGLMAIAWVFADAMMSLNGMVDALQRATRDGTSFVFGYLDGGPLPFAETAPGSAWTMGFQALPLLLVVSAVSALLFHWRVIPVVVQGFSLILRKTMGVGGALGVGVSSNIFVGMVEAPLIIAPYLRAMTRSELFTLVAVPRSSTRCCRARSAIS